MLLKNLYGLFVVQLLYTKSFGLTSEGTEFLIAFPPAYNFHTVDGCQLIIVSRHEASVNVEIPFLLRNETYTVQPNVVFTMNFSGTSRISAQGLSIKSIIVRSNKLISLFTYDYLSSNGGRRGYLIIPQTASDNLFYLNTFQNSYSSILPHSYYAIIARDDNTTVTVHSKISTGYAFQVSQILANFEYTMCYSSTQSQDMTGWKISSTGPISVISGHSNLRYSQDVSYSTQAIGSTVIPANVLGTTYVVPGISGGTTFTCSIRILAVENQTQIVYEQQPYVVRNEGEFIDFNRAVLSAPAQVYCTKLCAVALFYPQTAGAANRPVIGTFQLPIVPEHSFSNSLLFSSAIQEQAMTHFLSVVLQGNVDDTQKITLDGSSLGNSSSWQSLDVRGTSYMFTSRSVSAGLHSLLSSDSNTLFTAYLYGHYEYSGSAIGMSYGYPVGYGVTNQEISTTTTPTTGTTSLPEGDLNIPHYELILTGNFTSESGTDFDLDCSDQYSLLMKDRAVDMLQLVNSLIGNTLCIGINGDIRLDTVSTILITNLTEGGVKLDYIVAFSGTASFDDVTTCSDQIFGYLERHENWENPILPGQPGCPTPRFYFDVFFDGGRLWTCSFTAGALLRLPRRVKSVDLRAAIPVYELELYGNFTTDVPLSVDCIIEYGDDMTVKTNEMLQRVNGLIGTELCRSQRQGIYVLSTFTVLSANNMNGQTRAYFVKTSSEPSVTFNELISCATEVEAFLMDQNNWGVPLLPEQPPCPLLRFSVGTFFPQQPTWTCLD